MKAQKPEISVIIPTYNAEEFLPETLESLSKQCGVSFEVILSDGGSTDGTVDVFRDFTSAPSAYVSKPDRGVAHGLNRGMRLARSPILCWLNADDVYMRSDTLALAVKTLESPVLDRTAAFAYGNCMTLNKQGLIKRCLISYKPTGEDWRFGFNLFTGSLFFTKPLWQSFGGFSETNKVAFEYELVVSLFEQASPRIIPYYLAAFRQFEDGLSSKFREQMHHEREKILGVRQRRKIRVTRIIDQLSQGSLPASLANAVFQTSKGKHWSEVFE